MEHAIFGTRSLEFTFSTLALVAVVVRRMLKTLVTLGNICRTLLNLTKRLIFAMFNVRAPALPSKSTSVLSNSHGRVYLRYYSNHVLLIIAT